MNGAQMVFLLACEVGDGSLTGEALRLTGDARKAQLVAGRVAAAQLGHNGGPGSAHLAQLHQAAARVQAQLLAVEAGGLAEVASAAHAFRQAHGVWNFAPSRLRKCPRDRRRLLAAVLEAHAGAMAKRAGQLGHLRAKLCRINAAIAAAEGKGQA